MNSAPVLKPKKKSAGLRLPPRQKKKTAVAPAGPNLYVFQSTCDDLPAALCVTVHARNEREAYGAAYLLADRFAQHAIAWLKQPL